MIGPLACQCCDRPHTAACARCGAFACAACDCCHGCQQVICEACDTRLPGDPSFAYDGDAQAHPHVEVEW